METATNTEQVTEKLVQRAHAILGMGLSLGDAVATMLENDADLSADLAYLAAKAASCLSPEFYARIRELKGF